MRVTNLMMNSNMLNNINRNKEDLSKKFDQYATGQKIQRPSEDPVIAVRSLKYRSQLTELEQYYGKNIPDATSWMDITESALDNMNSLLTNMNSYCVQGATDTLEAEDRNSIAETLAQYKDQIYQCLNTDYAGRHVFAGYRTDTALLYEKETIDTTYTIQEPLTQNNIDRISYVTGGAEYEDNKTAEYYADAARTPKLLETYRIRLAYGSTDGLDKLTYIDEAGTEQKLYDKVSGVASGFVFTTLKSTDTTITNSTDTALIGESISSPYTVASDNEIRYIEDTGELILGNNAFKVLNNSKSINVEYAKTTFNTGDLKPEFYYNCTATTYKMDGNGNYVVENGKKVVERTVDYKAPSDQNIYYEINFGQNLKVNTMANETLDTTIGREIDEILASITEVGAVEEKLANVELMMKDKTRTDLDALAKLKEQIETELTLKKTVMQEKFSKGITTTKTVQNGETYITETGEKKQKGVSIAATSLGSRYKRLKLTEDRLLEQRTSFSELLNSNETVELEDAIINYNSAQVTYNASLSAAGKVVQNTLLDFL